MAKSRIKFGRTTLRKATKHSLKYYEVAVILDGSHSGFIGYGSTPAKAKANARKQLRTLGGR